MLPLHASHDLFDIQAPAINAVFNAGMMTFGRSPSLAGSRRSMGRGIKVTGG
jgi:hypothetical protein